MNETALALDAEEEGVREPVPNPFVDPLFDADDAPSGGPSLPPRLRFLLEDTGFEEVP